jgi:hypothetical protein
LLFAFGVAACVVFRAFGLSSAAVCVCCWLWLAVVVGVCLLALWGFCSPGVSFVFLFAGFASSVLLLFLLAAAVVFCPLILVAAVGVPLLVPVASARPGVSFFWWLCLVFVVWCSGLPGASARPGVFVFFSEWLWFVVGVCPLTLWGSAHVEVSISFFVWWFCPSVVPLFFLVAVVGICSLLLISAVGVSLLVPCGFCPPWSVFLLVVVSGVCCLVLWASWGFCPAWAVSVCFCCCVWR